MRRGLFITFEGGEGAGKSTQIVRLSSRLRAKGYRLTMTREPGGTPGAEAIRHVILSGAAQPFGTAMETMLFAAARADHVAQVIAPAAERGDIVLCDRFLDSTRAYQGGDDEAAALLRALERVTVGDRMPDLTLILDIDPREGLRRADVRRGLDPADRFEREDLKVHERRRSAFLAIAAREPERCVVVDASAPMDEVEAQVSEAVFAAIAGKPEGALVVARR